MKKKVDDKTVTMSSKGQIVIPAKVREALGIREGDKFVLKNLDGKIQLEPLSEVLKKKHPSFMLRLESIAKRVGEEWEGPDALTTIREMRDE